MCIFRRKKRSKNKIESNTINLETLYSNVYNETVTLFTNLYNNLEQDEVFKELNKKLLNIYYAYISQNDDIALNIFVINIFIKSILCLCNENIKKDAIPLLEKLFLLLEDFLNDRKDNNSYYLNENYINLKIIYIASFVALYNIKIKEHYIRNKCVNYLNEYNDEKKISSKSNILNKIKMLKDQLKYLNPIVDNIELNIRLINKILCFLQMNQFNIAFDNKYYVFYNANINYDICENLEKKSIEYVNTKINKMINKEYVNYITRELEKFPYDN